MNVVYIKKIVKIYHAARFAHVMVEREDFGMHSSSYFSRHTGQYNMDGKAMMLQNV